jgi:hypothetical protein
MMQNLPPVMVTSTHSQSNSSKLLHTASSLQYTALMTSLNLRQFLNPRVIVMAIGANRVSAVLPKHEHKRWHLSTPLISVVARRAFRFSALHLFAPQAETL